MSQSRKQHPYMKFEGSVLWRSVEKEIAGLVKNGDLKELTSRKYIVGSICRAIAGGKKSN
jgi:hypothetical protein